MNWNLEGKTINGLYIGLFPFQGKVLSSRVKFGGEVQHTVELDAPIRVYSEDRTRITVENVNVNRVLSDSDIEFYNTNQ